MGAHLVPHNALQTLIKLLLLLLLLLLLVLLSSKQQTLLLLAGRVAQPEAKLMIPIASCLAQGAFTECCDCLLHRFSLLVR